MFRFFCDVGGFVVLRGVFLELLQLLQVHFNDFSHGRWLIGNVCRELRVVRRSGREIYNSIARLSGLNFIAAPFCDRVICRCFGIEAVLFAIKKCTTVHDAEVVCEFSRPLSSRETPVSCPQSQCRRL